MDKILVCENKDRCGHLAYVICYNNSYCTCKIMCKLSQNDSPTISGQRALDKDNESNRFPHYGSKHHTEVAVNPGLNVVKLQCFIQVGNMQNDVVAIRMMLVLIFSNRWTVACAV